ncbi:MAG: DNA mismatch repair endonuclease MutL [Bacteroidetes bacterium]|jgi:DNA mismatch repair protein MutL|nr:DNA mismatch repair endonuclease MutL [Bacteroidota bacterium]
MADIIKLLPDSIANQIAAGEVVQRPASVVKELLENAVDAKATDIQTMIWNAGKTGIQIVDNGVGMSETDARMCFERHATSKIRDVHDLFNIGTFGFRGEAMASIAAVARVELKTRREENPLGTELIVEDSRLLGQQPVATAKGTSISVKNLFFNVPARKNFLKSDRIENRHITDEFIRAALAMPQIGFKLFIDNDLLYDLRPGNLKKRIIQLFGKAYEENLVELREQSDIVTIGGYVAGPSMARKSRGDQYFITNGRYIRSAYFNHCVQGAFDGLVAADSYPAFFISLQVPPNRIDVNVHPTKTEVKFEDERAIYAMLNAAIRKSINEYHLAPVLNFDQDRATIESWARPLGNSKFQFAGGDNSRASTGNHTSWAPPTGTRQSQAQHSNWKDLFDIPPNHDTATPAQQPAWKADISQVLRQPLQVGLKYLVIPIKSGLAVVHQARAHQRVLFEQFCHKLDKGKLASQKKLFPEVVQLGAVQFKNLHTYFAQLKGMGIDLDVFGNNALIVNGMPEELVEANVEEVLTQMAQDLSNDLSHDSLSVSHMLARSLALGAAIKTGKTMQSEEAASLIDQLFACKEPYFGLDGKPTIVVLPIDELDNKF